MGKGNFIGIVNNPSNTSVTGVWNLFEHHNAAKSNTWLYVPSIVSSGLVLYLDAGNPASYSGSGSTWFDLSGLNNNATLFNSPTWSSTNGGTFTFNGSNQYAALASGALQNFNSGITIFTIVNMGTGSNYERIIDFGSGAPSNNIILYRIGTSTTLALYIANGTTTTVDLQVASGITNSTIACYAATANGTNIKLYRNTSEIGTQVNSNLPVNTSRTNNYIGRSNWAADAYFESAMYVIMFYNRALSQEEITQNFNAFRGRYGL